MVDFPVIIQDVVAVAILGVDVPLDKMETKTEKTEKTGYEPENTSGIVYRPGEAGVAALIFSAGKIVCTGAKSVEKARESVNRVVEKIKNTGVDVPADFDVKIENIVAISKMPAPVNFRELAFSMPNAEYDPARFPGLVYRIPESKVSFLLFESGKVICSGARSMDELKKAMRKLQADLNKAGVKA
jgi:transcription initiation factor TFIID TATA-box-binding protein